EVADEERVPLDRGRVDDRHAPEARHATVRDGDPEVTLVVALLELDGLPVVGVHDHAGGPVKVQAQHGDRAADRVDARVAGLAATRRVVILHVRVGHEALQVAGAAVAVQELLVLREAHAEDELVVDVLAQLRGAPERLLGDGQPVRDRDRPGLLHGEAEGLLLLLIALALLHLGDPAPVAALDVVHEALGDGRDGEQVADVPGGRGRLDDAGLAARLVEVRVDGAEAGVGEERLAAGEEALDLDGAGGGLRLGRGLVLVAVDERGADRGGARAAAGLEGGLRGDVLLDLGEGLVEVLHAGVVLGLQLLDGLAGGGAGLAVLLDLLRLLLQLGHERLLDALELVADGVEDGLVHQLVLLRVSPNAASSRAMTAARTLVLRAFNSSMTAWTGSGAASATGGVPDGAATFVSGVVGSPSRR